MFCDSASGMSLHVAHLTPLTCRLGRANKSAPVVSGVCLPQLRQPASKLLPVAAASLLSQCDRIPRAFGPAPARSVACRSAEQVLELSEDSVEEALQVTDQRLERITIAAVLAAQDSNERPVFFQDAKQELMQLFDESVGITGDQHLSRIHDVHCMKSSHVLFEA